MSMTHITNTPTLTGSRLFSFFASKLAAFQEARARTAVYNDVKAKLSRMSDRDLADIGTNRLLIDDVARQAAYGDA
ncbi:MAG: DUF1127 domain-containing protein [Yoonia sp.]|uniref:DUF1127 domain-containing protein n=1 Tax=Yoonia sp. TaxID=2212373 RepID=UPI003EF89DED